MASGDGGEITPGEIARTLGRLEKAIASLDAKVEGLAFVRQDVWAAQREALIERIEQVHEIAKADTAEVRKDLTATQENLRWVVRTIAAVFITVIIGAVLAANGLGR